MVSSSPILRTTCLGLVLHTSLAFIKPPTPSRHLWSLTSGVQLAAGKGFGAPREARNSSSSDPQLLYYHQQSEAVTTEYLRFSPPKRSMHTKPPQQQQQQQAPPGMRVFDRVVDFPCIFTIKVIGEPDDSFDMDMIQLVGEITGKPWDQIKYSARDTDSRRYRSLTIHAPVDNADQLYAIYEEIGKDGRVMFKF